MHETLYLYTERRTVKARNLAADPRLVVHLESAQDVLIVRGTAEDVGTPAQVPEVVAALSAKYPSEEDRPYLPAADPDFDVVYAIRPQSARMWRLPDFEEILPRDLERGLGRFRSAAHQIGGREPARRSKIGAGRTQPGTVGAAFVAFEALDSTVG